MKENFYKKDNREIFKLTQEHLALYLMQFAFKDVSRKHL